MKVSDSTPEACARKRGLAFEAWRNAHGRWVENSRFVRNLEKGQRLEPVCRSNLAGEPQESLLGVPEGTAESAEEAWATSSSSYMFTFSVSARGAGLDFLRSTPFGQTQTGQAPRLRQSNPSRRVNSASKL